MDQLVEQKKRIIDHFQKKGGASFAGVSFGDLTVTFKNVCVLYRPSNQEYDTYIIHIQSPIGKPILKDPVPVGKIASSFIDIVSELE